AHPETLYLYLKRASPSVETAKAEQPALSGAEITRCYVVLHDRAPGSWIKLICALRHVVTKASPSTAAPAPPAAAPPPAKTAEERLARLKELHDKGLITDEVYAEEQKKI